MFINLSNHPFAAWTQEQKDAASEYGEIRDLPFPNVPPEMGEEEVAALGSEYIDKVRQLLAGTEGASAVHLAGEPTFVFFVATRLLALEIRVLTSTTRREVVDLGNGEKLAKFRFVRFREYSLGK